MTKGTPLGPAFQEIADSEIGPIVVRDNVVSDYWRSGVLAAGAEACPGIYKLLRNTVSGLTIDAYQGVRRRDRATEDLGCDGDDNGHGVDPKAPLRHDLPLSGYRP